MDTKDLDARLKAADPAKEIQLNEGILISASVSKHRIKLNPIQFRFSVVTATAALVIAALVPGAINNPGQGNYLISMGSGATTPTAGEKVSSDSLVQPYGEEMIPWVNYVYSPGSELSSQSGRGMVYKGVFDGQPKLILARVAKAFGVPGEVKKQPLEYGSDSFIVGPNDASAKSVQIYGSYWSYNDPAAWPEPKCLHYTKDEKGEGTWCDSYEDTRADLSKFPSESEIKELTVKLFTECGLEISEADVQVHRDQWGAYSIASQKVDGEPTPIEWSLQWGVNGVLGSASGNAITFVEQGAFETISEHDAVKRITDWRYSAQVGNLVWESIRPSESVMLGGIAVRDTVGTNPEIAPSPKTTIAKVNKAMSLTVMIYDKDGTPWLVPGYVLTPDLGENFWPSVVFALKDGVVELPDYDSRVISY